MIGRRLGALLVGAVSATMVVAMAPAAQAATLGTATNVRVSTTYSSATVTFSAAKNATRYRVCLYADYASTRCSYYSPYSTSRRVTFKQLRPTPGADYFVRVVSFRGSKWARTGKTRFDLPVPRPGAFANIGWTTTTLTATWPALTNANNYQLQIATTSDMRTGLKTISTRNRSYRFTGLTPARTYWIRVRGANSDRPGAYGPTSYRRIASAALTMNVATFNLCGQNKCRNDSNGILTWYLRKSYAAKLALLDKPLILATQESGEDTDFGRALPSYYKLAKRKSAKSLFYDSRALKVRRTAYITMRSSPGRYAVVAEMEHLDTHTQFVAVDAHLSPYKKAVNDLLRQGELKVLLPAVDAFNSRKLPVVYLGDWNSNSDNANTAKHGAGAFDAVEQAFAAARIPEVNALTDNLIDWKYNSFNGGEADPRDNGDHIDRIFLRPGAFDGSKSGALSARIVVDLVDGRYRTPFASDHNPVAARVVIPGFRSHS